MMDESVRQAFRNDGAVLIEGCLDETQLAQCHDAFLWAVDNPGPHVFRPLDGTELRTHIDNANPLAKDRLDELVSSLPFGKLFADLWGSKHVWYFAEEIFLKQGGTSGRGPWHQDTANLPWAGRHWGNAWISFQSLPKQNSLEIVRGSHRGIQYDGASFLNPDDPTEPLYGDGTYLACRTSKPNVRSTPTPTTCSPGPSTRRCPCPASPLTPRRRPRRRSHPGPPHTGAALLRRRRHLPYAPGREPELRPQRSPLRRRDGEAEPG